MAAAPPPDSRLYFEFLYGLWPTTTLTFLRRPLVYLKDVQLQSPYVEDWDEVIDIDEVRSRAKVSSPSSCQALQSLNPSFQPILRSHVIHPSILFRDSKDEAADLSRWTADGLDVPGIVSECISLDVRNAAAALPPRSRKGKEKAMVKAEAVSELGVSGVGLPFPSDSILGTGFIASPDVSTPLPDDLGKDAIAKPIQEIVATQIALKSSPLLGLDDVPTALRDAIELDREDTFEAPRDVSSTPGRQRAPLRTPRRDYFDESASPSHPGTPMSGNTSRDLFNFGLGPAPSSPPMFVSPLPLTPPSRASPRLRFRSLALTGNEVSETTAQQALEAISSLQREVLLLRNELNFELWLKKQHLSHMGKLHRDRILAKREEAERQNLVRGNESPGYSS